MPKTEDVAEAEEALGQGREVIEGELAVDPSEKVRLEKEVEHIHDCLIATKESKQRQDEDKKKHGFRFSGSAASASSNSSRGSKKSGKSVEERKRTEACARCRKIATHGARECTETHDMNGKQLPAKNSSPRLKSVRATVLDFFRSVRTLRRRGTGPPR